MEHVYQALGHTGNGMVVRSEPILAFPFTGCVTLGNALNLSVLHFLYETEVRIVGSSEIEINHRKKLALYLALNKHYLQLSVVSYLLLVIIYLVSIVIISIYR